MLRKAVSNLSTKSIQLVKNYKTTQTLEFQCKKYNLFKQISLICQHYPQFSLIPRLAKIKNGIGISTLYFDENLRLSMYYLPENQIMKLHNHPQMSVVSCLIYGEMQADIYTPLMNSKYLKLQKQLKKGDISYIDGQISNENNLHQFKAIQNTFFLDLIFPEYQISTRQCKFYDQVSKSTSNEYELKEIKDYYPDFFQF